MRNWLNIGVKLSRTGVGNVCPAEFSSNPEQKVWQFQFQVILFLYTFYKINSDLLYFLIDHFIFWITGSLWVKA